MAAAALSAAPLRLSEEEKEWARVTGVDAALPVLISREPWSAVRFTWMVQIERAK
jgi:hypothetical protein